MAMQMWTRDHTRALRAEIAARFAARTPPTRIDEILPEQRVGRGEMRRWVSEQGFPPAPETDIEWLRNQAAWYRRMARQTETGNTSEGGPTL
jgi:hypothetical protein